MVLTMTTTLDRTPAATTALTYAVTPAEGRQDAWQGSLAAYLAEVGQRTGSHRTPAEYGRVIERFLDLAGDPRGVTPAHVHGYAYGLGPSGREPSPSTVAVRLAALSGFLDFLRRMGTIPTNPAAEVKRPRNRDAVPHGLDAAELRRLLEATGDSPAGRRDAAIIVTAVLTGLRRSEVMGLRPSDLSRNGRVYYSVRVKGGRERRRELPMPAFDAITAYLEAAGRPLEELTGADLLFPVTSSAFYANLRRYAIRAGLEGVTPHVLRHSAAKLRRDAGATIEQVQSFLGHRNLATTARYLARLEGEHDDGWQGVAAALGL